MYLWNILCSLLLSCAFSLNRQRLPFQCRLTNDWKLMLSAGISLLFIEKLSDSIFDFATFVFNCCFCSHRSNLNLQGTCNYTHTKYTVEHHLPAQLIQQVHQALKLDPISSSTLISDSVHFSKFSKEREREVQLWGETSSTNKFHWLHRYYIA